MKYKLEAKKRIPRRQVFIQPDVQRGAVLIITITVLLALTILALASTSSNQMQSIMVRNNQFRLEAFNVSYSELDAQIDILNQRDFTEAAPEYINALITTKDELQRLRISSADTNQPGSGTGEDLDVVKVRAPNTSPKITQEVGQTYHQSCVVLNEQVGLGDRLIPALNPTNVRYLNI